MNYSAYLGIDMTATGLHIKELFVKKGLSVKDISGYMGMSEQAVYKWQRGESLPTIDNFVNLSKLLETSIESMVVIRNNTPGDTPSGGSFTEVMARKAA